MKRNAFFSVICVMLFITGCTTNHLDNVMINSNAVQVGDSWSPLDSIERAGVIHCETEEDNYSFEVHAYDGSFLVEQQNGKMQYVSDLVIEELAMPIGRMFHQMVKFSRGMEKKPF